MSARDECRGVVVVAIGLNDILRIKTFFRQNDNDALMVSYWQVIAINVPQPYPQFAQAFGWTMMHDGRVQDVVSTSAVLERVVVDNLSQFPEFGEWVEDLPGIASGDPAPAFNALSIKQSVLTRTTRAGYKRIPFISEQIMNGNNASLSVITEAALQTFFGFEFNIVFNDPDTGDVDYVIAPIIVGRTLNSAVPPVYEEDLTRLNLVSGAVIQGITSQVSRKA